MKKIGYLKKFTVICIFIIVIELIYMGYFMLFHRTKSLYFDGINSIVSNDSYLITVGSNNDNNNYYEKAKISKYNKKREKVFDKLYNVGYNSAYFGVALDDDSVVVVGSYEKTKKDYHNSVRRALIVKYDLDGEIVFENDFQVLDNSKFTNIMVVDDGYLVVGQSVYKSTKVGSKNGGALLVKYDKDGNLLWSKTYGNNKFAIFNDLLLVDDFIYTVGSSDNHMGVICKYDLEGNFITNDDYQNTDDLGFSSIALLDENLYVSGASYINSNSTKSLIIEYDLDCNYQKQVIDDSKNNFSKFNKLIVDENNNLIAIGIVAQNKNKVAKFNYDGVIGKYNSSLEKISIVTYGDKSDDYFTDIQLDSGNYLVVGYSSYEDGSYLSKFIRYSDALKVLGVDS